MARIDYVNYKRFAHLNLWKPVTGEDIRIFAAHLIILGLIKKLELEEYWPQKELTRTPLFGHYMSRDHFQMILSNFYIADNSDNPPKGEPLHNPLAKLQPFIDLISESLKSYYSPGENISVDEGCCPWKGHLSFHQYNPQKPAKFHIKLFQVSDPSTGYVLHFSIFTGASSCHRHSTMTEPDCTTTTKVVMTLCTDAQVLDKGHCIYFDNYFTSVQLLNELWMLQTTACGTVWNRKLGPMLLQSNSPRLLLDTGASCALRRGPVLAFKWRQTKPKYVYMLSTKHCATVIHWQIGWLHR